MIKNLVPLLAVFFFMMSAAITAEAGYRKDAWGSNTWIGPGRPPHWSPPPLQPRTRVPKPVQPIVPEKPVYPGGGVHPPLKPGGSGGYWKDKNKRWYYHRSRRPGIIYYRSPRTETIIIEREKVVPVYVPVIQRQRPSKQQCGGRTVTRTDPQSGEMIIEYVSSSRDCP
jgi:hypothetical protein